MKGNFVKDKPDHYDPRNDRFSCDCVSCEHWRSGRITPGALCRSVLLKPHMKMNRHMPYGKFWLYDHDKRIQQPNSTAKFFTVECINLVTVIGSYEVDPVNRFHDRFHGHRQIVMLPVDCHPAFNTFKGLLLVTEAKWLEVII